MRHQLEPLRRLVVLDDRDRVSARVERARCGRRVAVARVDERAGERGGGRGDEDLGCGELGTRGRAGRSHGDGGEHGGLGCGGERGDGACSELRIELVEREEDVI